jgi:hypothetical protein
MNIFRPLLLIAVACATSTALAQGLTPEEPDDLSAYPEQATESRGLGPARVDLPARADLRASLPPPGNQVATDTCVSWAVTYAAGSEALRHDPAVPKNLALSPGFTYPLAGGNRYCRGDTKISQTLDVLKTIGALPFDEYRFDPGWCGRSPTRAERSRAAEFRIRGWHWINAQDLDLVKFQLAYGRPVIFGMPMGPQLARLRGDGVFGAVEQGPNTAEHAMVLIGYDNRKQAFRLINSLGRAWGDGGYAWLAFNVWQQQVRVGYVIDLQPEGDSPR